MTDGDAKYAARKLVLGAVISASIATAMSSAGIADATCTSVRGTGASAHARAVQLSRSSSTRSPRFAQYPRSGGGANTSKKVMAPRVFRLVPNLRPLRKPCYRAIADDPVLVAESMVGNRCFNLHGCEDFGRRRSWPHHRDRY